MILMGLIVGGLFRVYIYPKIWARVAIRLHRVQYGAAISPRKKD